MQAIGFRGLWTDGRTGPLATSAANATLAHWEQRAGERLASAKVGRAGAVFEGERHVLLGRTSDTRSLARNRGQVHLSTIYPDQFEEVRAWTAGKGKTWLVFLVSYGGASVRYVAIPGSELAWAALPKRGDGSAFIKVYEADGRLSLAQTDGMLDVSVYAAAIPTPAVPRTVDAVAAIPTFDWQARISIDPARRSGKPCIRGTRMTVYDILEYLASGMSQAEVLDDFPDLEPDDIRAALAFAVAMGRRVRSVPA